MSNVVTIVATPGMIQRTVESNRNDVAILREMEFDLVSDMSFVQQRQSRGFFEKNTLTKNNSDQKPVIAPSFSIKN